MVRNGEKKRRGVYEKVPGSEVWWIQYYDAEGRRRREKVGRKSDAINLYQKRKADALSGLKLPSNLRSKNNTVSQVIDQALKWYGSHRPKSCRSAKTHLEAAREAFGNRRASDLTPSDVDRWLTSHTASDATRNRYKATLGRALQLAVVDGKLDRNVARMVTARREPSGRVRWLRDDEEARLTWAIHADWPDYLPSFYIALNTGMRQGEQFSLMWDEVDFDRRKVYLDKTKNGSSREVPLNQSALAAFAELKERRRKDVPWVFLSKRYGGQRLIDPTQWFPLAVANAGISKFTWHCLRHTFCSRLVMAGVNLKVVQELAGHKSITMTARYAHLAPQHLSDAVALLDRQR